MPSRNMIHIENAMEKIQSKFKLVIMLSKRAKMLREYKGRYIEGNDEHVITRSAREIAKGEVTVKEPESKAKK